MRGRGSAEESGRVYRIGGGDWFLPIVRSARRRRLALRVRDGRVEVAAPLRVSVGVIDEFVLSSEGWIVGALARLQAHAARFPAERFWLEGVDWEVGLRGGDGRGLEWDAGSRVVWWGGSDLGEGRRAVAWALRGLAKARFPGRVWELAEVTGLRPRVVSVRGQRTRWGSCSARGTVSLNWRLVMVPSEVRDYLIVHELCHLVEMNHSERFWGLVDVHWAGWREAERWLKAHGRTVMGMLDEGA